MLLINLIRIKFRKIKIGYTNLNKFTKNQFNIMERFFKMKISFLKFKDSESYKMVKGLGFDVYEIETPDEVDLKIKELKENKYTTIILSSDLASFSEDLISKYKGDNDISIIITPTKK